MPFLKALQLTFGCAMPIKPSLQSLWLADSVTKDPETGKVDVRGMFDQIEIQEPSREFTSPGNLYCGLRDVHGSLTLSFRYTDLQDNSILVDRSLPVRHDDPLVTLDVVVAIKKIPVPHAGVYLWELVWENEVIGSSRLTANIV
jgi:hypothetical protein